MNQRDVQTILAFMDRVEMRGREAFEYVRLVGELEKLLQPPQAVPKPPIEKANGQMELHG